METTNIRHSGSKDFSPKKKKRKRYKVFTLIFAFLFTCASVTAVTFGVKYSDSQKQLAVANQALDIQKLATFPQIEKIAAIKSTEDYYAFLMQDEFVVKYKLKLDSSVRLHFRDVKTSETLKAGDFGKAFSIAYVRYENEDIKIFFSIPYTEVGNTTGVKYVYVTLSEISAKLPTPATGEFTLNI